MTQPGTDWHARWREGRLGFHRDEVHPILESVWPTLGIADRSRVFVPLCGKSLDMRWLAARGHEVVGVELSPRAAEAFFEDWGRVAEVSRRGAFDCHEADGVSILVGDVFDLQGEDLGGAQAFYDRASVVALEPGLRTRYVDRLASVLPVGAVGLLIALESAVDGDREGPPYATSREDVERMFSDRFATDVVVAPDFDGVPDVRQLHEHAHRLTRLA